MSIDMIVTAIENAKKQSQENGLDRIMMTIEFADKVVELLKEQKGTGCWEWVKEDKYRCSECNNTTYVDECMEEPQYLFCPYCGHKMTWAGR